MCRTGAFLRLISVIELSPVLSSYHGAYLTAPMKGDFEQGRKYNQPGYWSGVIVAYDYPRLRTLGAPNICGSCHELIVGGEKAADTAILGMPQC